MSTIQTTGEVEQEHLKALGPDLGPLYHALHNEIIWLYAKWLEYRKLFAESKERIGLLNDTAGFFFKVVQDTFWEDILLSIARLTDPPTQRRFENLTFLRLPALVKEPSLAAEVEKLVMLAKDSSSFAREWRNRHIAHRELSLAIDANAQPLITASRQEVGETLGKFADVLNRLHAHYFQSEVAFDHLLTGPSDANALVSALEIADQTYKLQEKHLAAEDHPIGG